MERKDFLKHNYASIFFFIIYIYICIFFETGSPCVVETILKFTDLPALVSIVLKLQVCATMLGAIMLLCCFCFFFFFLLVCGGSVVLGFELRASHLPGWHSTTQATLPILFCVGHFQDMIS
jgi:hypothetical protein